MFVVFEINGKQYDGVLGEEMRVDLINNISGPEFNINKVLLFKKSDKEVWLGKPYIEGALLKTEVKGEVKDKKIKVFFYRQRKNSKKLKGHRQRYTVIKPVSISIAGEEIKIN